MQCDKTKSINNLPCYVPCYIRSVGFECNYSTQTRRYHSTNAIGQVSNSSITKVEARPRRRQRRRTLSSNLLTSNLPCTYRPRLRGRSIPSEPVHVKQAVAAMEARITAFKNEKAKIERTKPQNVLIRPKDPPDLAQRKARHRRSMSDPNIMNDSPKSVKDLKEIWKRRLESDKQSAIVDNTLRFGGSSTSLNSVGSSKSVEKNFLGSDGGHSLENKSISKEAAESSEYSDVQPKTNHPISKKSIPRYRSITVGHLPLAKTTPVNTATTLVDNRSPSPDPTENLTFNQKLLLFGEVKRSLKRFTNDPSSENPVFRRSWSEESANQLADKSMDIIRDTPYSRVNGGEMLMQLNEKRQARKAKLEEEKEEASTLKRIASLAKEKRRPRASTTSAVSTPSDDEDKVKNESFVFNGVRRRSKDYIKVTPKQSPSLLIQNTESSIFGASAKAQDGTTRSDHDESELHGEQRKIALHKLLENKSYDPVIVFTTSTTSNLQCVSEEPSAPEFESSIPQTAVRPTNLALNDFSNRLETNISTVEQSHTSVSHQRSESPKKDHPKSMQQTSPTTPDKRSSGFSEEEEVEEEICKNTTNVTENQSQIEEEEVNHSPNVELFSNNANIDLTNKSPTTPVSSGINFLEEYDKIAKELNEERNEDVTKVEKEQERSDDSSTISIDSGYRNSLEEKNAKRWSGYSTDTSSVEENQSREPEKSDELATITSPRSSLKEPNEVKLHNIAKELLSTEESYVDRLYLIDQVFHKKILEAAEQKHIMPEQVVGKIFSHIPAIYSFHSSFLLPQLKERLENWDTNPCIGDIMTKAAPFLKMYSLYVQHFDEAMKLINVWTEKSKDFDSIIKEIQKTPECKSLTLQHHMLGPVQRVPRYRLLLNDYVKKLPDDSPDCSEAQTALDLITNAATHSNETMKKIENFHKLVNIFNNLADVNFDIVVDVSRELLKEGKIIKISARNGEKHERYLYLFSDMLLCCAPQRRLGKTYRVTAKIDLDGMSVNEVNNPQLPFVFCVNGLQKSMEFATNAKEDKENWIKTLNDAIEERKDRQRTFKSVIGDQSTIENTLSPVTPTALSNPLISPIHSKQLIPTIEIDDADLGTRAPRFIKDHEVNLCMCCTKSFNRVLRRRHHCRACGRVVCSECCENKIMLQYDRSKPMKVCKRCYRILSGRKRSETFEGIERKGVLEVQADEVAEKSILANHLYFRENQKKKGWSRTWCVIPENELCLYFYSAPQDIRAQMTLPLPGFEVEDIDFPDHKFCFRLTQARKSYHFGCDEQMVREKWKYAINQASRGYDLTKKEVDRLGRPVSSSESDDNLEDAKEEKLVKVNEETVSNQVSSKDEEVEEEDLNETDDLNGLIEIQDDKTDLNSNLPVNSESTIIEEDAW